MLNNKTEVIIPSPDEDAIINAGIADDPDTFELSDEWFAGAKPSHKAVPHILERYRRSRGKQKEPTKTAIHIRLDADNGFNQSPFVGRLIAAVRQIDEA